MAGEIDLGDFSSISYNLSSFLGYSGVVLGEEYRGPHPFPLSYDEAYSADYLTNSMLCHSLLVHPFKRKLLDQLLLSVKISRNSPSSFTLQFCLNWCRWAFLTRVKIQHPFTQYNGSYMHKELEWTPNSKVSSKLDWRDS